MKPFVFLITGTRNNDMAIARYAADAPVIQFKLPYVQPYSKFDEIKRFQVECRFKPFEDTTEESRYVAIDVSEWINNSADEYFQIFLKYLHDCDEEFYKCKYIFTVGDADKDISKDLYKIVNRYLDSGEMLLDKTFVETSALAEYIAEKYDVSVAASGKLAEALINDVDGYAGLENIMNDIRRHLGKEKHINTNDLITVSKIKTSKLHLFYGKEIGGESKVQNKNKNREVEVEYEGV